MRVHSQVQDTRGCGLEQPPAWGREQSRLEGETDETLEFP